ncbi:MAG: hypothetical protein ACRDTA_27645 [Pseudonocardiaceae bacterium]
MSDAMNLAELDGQHAELLAARTVLSMFSAQVGEDVTPSGGGLGEIVKGVAQTAGLSSSSTPGSTGSADGSGTG